MLTLYGSIVVFGDQKLEPLRCASGAWPFFRARLNSVLGPAGRECKHC